MFLQKRFYQNDVGKENKNMAQGGIDKIRTNRDR